MALKPCRECKKEVSTSAATCPHCGTKSPTARGKPVSAGMGCLIVGVVLLIVGSLVSRTNDTPVAPPTPEATALSALTLDFKWQVGGFGNVMLADFTVTNVGERGIKDFTIRCIHSAKSGTEIDRNTKVIYDVVPAKTTKKFKDVNMGFINSQAESSSCSILKLAMQ
jgi:hypothetical protein